MKLDNEVVNANCRQIQQESTNVKIVDSFFFSILCFHGVERGQASNKMTANFYLLIVSIHCPIRQYLYVLAASFTNCAILCFNSALLDESALQALSMYEDFLVWVFQ